MWIINYPSKDSTIYEAKPDLNVGSDEVLEINTSNDGSSRVLLDFDISRFQSELEDIEYGGINFKVYLRMFVARVWGTDTKFEILANPLTDDWEVGTGRKGNSIPTEDGVSWIYRTRSDQWNNAGGDFSTDEANQVFDYEQDLDVFMDVTDIMTPYLMGEKIFNGLILRRSDENEIKESELLYFGQRTHTIFSPQLILAFDNSEYFDNETELFDESRRMHAELVGLKDQYKKDIIARMRVNARLRFYDRPFLESFGGREDLILPEGSLTYEITDARTGTTIVPHGDHSKVSLDMVSGIGYYFMLDLSNFQPKRYYNVELRYQSPTGFTKNFPTQRFEVIN